MAERARQSSNEQAQDRDAGGGGASNRSALGSPSKKQRREIEKRLRYARHLAERRALLLNRLLAGGFSPAEAEARTEARTAKGGDRA